MPKKRLDRDETYHESNGRHKKQKKILKVRSKASKGDRKPGRGMAVPFNITGPVIDSDGLVLPGLVDYNDRIMKKYKLKETVTDPSTLYAMASSPLMKNMLSHGKKMGGFKRAPDSETLLRMAHAQRDSDGKTIPKYVPSLTGVGRYYANDSIGALSSKTRAAFLSGMRELDISSCHPRQALFIGECAGLQTQSMNGLVSRDKNELRHEVARGCGFETTEGVVLEKYGKRLINAIGYGGGITTNIDIMREEIMKDGTELKPIPYKSNGRNIVTEFGSENRAIINHLHKKAKERGHFLHEKLVHTKGADYKSMTFYSYTHQILEFATIFTALQILVRDGYVGYTIENGVVCVDCVYLYDGFFLRDHEKITDEVMKSVEKEVAALVNPYVRLGMKASAEQPVPESIWKELNDWPSSDIKTLVDQTLCQFKSNGFPFYGTPSRRSISFEGDGVVSCGRDVFATVHAVSGQSHAIIRFWHTYVGHVVSVVVPSIHNLLRNERDIYNGWVGVSENTFKNLSDTPSITCDPWGQPHFKYDTKEFTDNSLMFIKAVMGSGKTFGMLNMVTSRDTTVDNDSFIGASSGDGIRDIFITVTPRRELNNSIAATACNDFGMERIGSIPSEFDTSLPICEGKYYICVTTINAFSQILSSDVDMNRISAVFIDEGKTCIGNYVSLIDTHKKKEISMAMRRLRSSGVRVIVSDADLDENTVTKYMNMCAIGKSRVNVKSYAFAHPLSSFVTISYKKKTEMFNVFMFNLFFRMSNVAVTSNRSIKKLVEMTNHVINFLEGRIRMDGSRCSVPVDDVVKLLGDIHNTTNEEARFLMERVRNGMNVVHKKSDPLERRRITSDKDPSRLPVDMLYLLTDDNKWEKFDHRGVKVMELRSRAWRDVHIDIERLKDQPPQCSPVVLRRTDDVHICRFLWALGSVRKNTWKKCDSGWVSVSETDEPSYDSLGDLHDDIVGSWLIDCTVFLYSNIFDVGVDFPRHSFSSLFCFIRVQNGSMHLSRQLAARLRGRTPVHVYTETGNDVNVDGALFDEDEWGEDLDIATTPFSSDIYTEYVRACRSSNPFDSITEAVLNIRKTDAKKGLNDRNEVGMANWMTTVRSASSLLRVVENTWAHDEEWVTTFRNSWDEIEQCQNTRGDKFVKFESKAFQDAINPFRQVCGGSPVENIFSVVIDRRGCFPKLSLEQCLRFFFVVFAAGSIFVYVTHYLIGSTPIPTRSDAHVEKITEGRSVLESLLYIRMAVFNMDMSEGGVGSFDNFRDLLCHVNTVLCDFEETGVVNIDKIVEMGVSSRYKMLFPGKRRNNKLPLVVDFTSSLIKRYFPMSCEERKVCGTNIHLLTCDGIDEIMSCITGEDMEKRVRLYERPVVKGTDDFSSLFERKRKRCWKYTTNGEHRFTGQTLPGVYYQLDTSSIYSHPEAEKFGFGKDGPIEIGFEQEIGTECIDGYGIIVFRKMLEGNEFLLLKGTWSGLWTPSNGRVDNRCVSHKEGALLELGDDTGIENVDFVDGVEEKVLIKPGVYAKFFLARVDKRCEIVLSREHKEFAWATVSQCIEGLDRKYSDLIYKLNNCLSKR